MGTKYEYDYARKYVEIIINEQWYEEIEKAENFDRFSYDQINLHIRIKSFFNNNHPDHKVNVTILAGLYNKYLIKLSPREELD